MSKEEVCLVTGGSGMIGSHVVDELIRRGDKVVILDPSIPIWANKHIINGDAIWVYGINADLYQVNKIRRSFYVKEIYDLGWILGTEEGIPRYDSVSMGVIGARNIAEMSIDTGAPVFYLMTEFFDYSGFSDGYTIGKNASYFILDEYSKHHGIRFVRAKAHHVYSERQQLIPARKMLPTFIAYALCGRDIKIFGRATAEKKMDYVHGKDVGFIIVELMKRGLYDVIWDIGGSDNNFLTVEEIAYLVCKVVKDKLKNDVGYTIIGDVRLQPPTSKKATNNWRNYISHFDFIDFRESLPSVVDAYRNRFTKEELEMAVAYFERRLK